MFCFQKSVFIVFFCFQENSSRDGTIPMKLEQYTPFHNLQNKKKKMIVL